MFKTTGGSLKGEAARAQILDSALRLFRQDGFEATTMRDVASSAGVAIGLAYYYFPAKESLVAAYYDEVQSRHATLLEERLPGAHTFTERLSLLLHSKIDILQFDRKLLGALFRFTGDPTHPLSLLGEGTRRLRRECIALFSRIVEPERLPGDLADVVPVLLWTMHMGIILYFLYDSSPQVRRTRRLIDSSVAIVSRMLGLAKIPLLRPVRRQVAAFLRESGLIASA